MNIKLTLGALEEFEDEAGIGVFTLLNGGEREWTIKRMRALAVASGHERKEVDAWLARDLMGALTVCMDALLTALAPPPEAEEHLSGAKGGGESTGNSGSGAGLSP